MVLSRVKPMRSRAVRLFCGAVAWIAIGVASSYLIHFEQQIASQRRDQRAFDLSARETTERLWNLRIAEQAYVAEGQGVASWTSRVAQLTDEVGAALETLRKSATTLTAQSAIDEAAATLTEFVRIDKRAQDYLSSDQQLMAGDVIFTEGGQAAMAAAQQVEAARRAEQETLDAAEITVRTQEKMALAGAGGLVGLIVLLLGVTGNSRSQSDQPASNATTAFPAADSNGLSISEPRPALVSPPVLHSPAAPVPVASQAPEPAPDSVLPPALRAAAELCTDFGCARDASEVQALLARAAEAMNASGLIVWLGSASGADLTPVLTHGYSQEVRARLPDVPRSADNATAAAYRSGEAQLVPQTHEPRSSGAIVAPILSPDGCIGALSVEVRSGEPSDSVQALTAIVAAQLATVLEATQTEHPAARLAASS